MEPQTFNIFHGLFETGDYHVIVEKFMSFLDLETLYTLSLCNKTCYKYLKPYISQKKVELRMFWLSPLQPQSLRFIQRRNILDVNLDFLNQWGICCKYGIKLLKNITM